MSKKIYLILISLFLGGCLLAGSGGSTPQASPAPPTAVEVTGSGPFSKPLLADPPPGSQVEQTDHFTLYYPVGEQAGAAFVGMILEDNLERVSADLGYRSLEKFKVFIYPDLEAFHAAIEMPDAPEWVVAAGYVSGIQMVTPRLISAELLEKTVVHELVHALQGAINPDAPFWMVEGVAMYESGMSEGVHTRIGQAIQEDKIPSLAALDTLSEDGFEQAGGYAIGYTVVEFVVQAYGQAVLAEWVKTPRDYQGVFGESEESFEKRWWSWLVERYKAEANPKAFLSRQCRRHTKFCPGWKAYQAHLASQR